MVETLYSHESFVLSLLFGLGLAMSIRPSHLSIQSLSTEVKVPLSNLELKRDGNGMDPYDLSEIKTWAALGDSYASGIGAGQQLGSILADAWFCSRWSKAYPYILNQKAELGTGTRDFQFLACSGYTSNQIKDEQVSKLKDGSQQLITLSSGGNDVYLSSILNACVYQVSVLTDANKKCQEALDKASETIDKELGDWLDSLYSALKTKLSADGKIYVTGYSQFWNSETARCDEVSWYVPE
ncbi:hypothetical protein J1614_010653 [Plenodomus biglobosus]|nr:hypothetical protein J1614_010653 [Plenodomus biglobosus]